MATVEQLNRQIKQLQDEMRYLKAEDEKFRRRMKAEMEEQTRRYELEFKETLRRQKNETEQLYMQRIRTFQEEMLRESDRKYRELEQCAKEIEMKQRKKIDELSAYNEELCKLLKDIKHNVEERDACHLLNVQNALRELEECRKETDTTPHEFFFKGEFDIIDSHATDIEGIIENQMYEAAMADANSVMLEFELLQVKVEQAFQEWLSAFEDYCRLVRQMEQRIRLLEKQTIHTAAGKFCMTISELEYWSSHTYLAFKEKISKALKTIEDIEKNGIISYLKSTENVGRRAIFSSVTEAKIWQDELAGIINCILSERLFSDERWKLGKDAHDILAGEGYVLIRKGFRRKKKNGKDIEAPIDCYEVVESLQGRDKIRITLVPIREHGVTVKNECIVSLDAETIQDRCTIENVITTNVNRIQPIVSSGHVIGLVPEGCQTLEKVLAQRTRAKDADPASQIKYLEKKYRI